MGGVLGEVDAEAGERRELAEPDEASVEEADHEDHVIRRGERALPGGLPSPVERDEGQVGASDQAEGDAERRGPKEAGDGQVGREDETEVRVDGPAEVATDRIGPETGEEAERESVPPAGGEADEFQGEDGGGVGSAENGSKARADPAEEQGAAFFIRKPPRAS